MSHFLVCNFFFVLPSLIFYYQMPRAIKPHFRAALNFLVNQCIMKKSWYSSVREYNQKNPNADVSKKDFCSVLKPTWEDVMRPPVLTMAFRNSGIYPLDKDKVLEKLLDGSSNPREQSVASSSLANNATHNAPSATDQAFEVLDAALSAPTRSKYRQRVQENYDLEGSPTFVAWKKLHSLVHKPEQTCSTPSLLFWSGTNMFHSKKH